jgi:hypothetical protein
MDKSGHLADPVRRLDGHAMSDHEKQGAGFDPGATGHELQGRALRAQDVAPTWPTCSECDGKGIVVIADPVPPIGTLPGAEAMIERRCPFCDGWGIRRPGPKPCV